MKRAWIILLIGLFLFVVIMNGYVGESDEEGFLNNLMNVFSFKWLVDSPIIEGYGYGSDKCGEDCVDKYSCSDNGIVLNSASCGKGKCVYSDGEMVEKCGICETCGLVKYYQSESVSSEKPYFEGSIFKNLEDLSSPVEKIVFNYFLGDFGNVIYGVGVAGLMVGLFGQQGYKDYPSTEDTGASFPILWSNWFGQPKKGETPYVQPRCLSQKECEEEKNMCSEYSNKNDVEKYCGGANPIYSCVQGGGGICKTASFTIKEINGLSPEKVLQDCCDWAKRFEFEKCKNEVDLGIKQFAKYKLKGGDYNGRTLNGEVIINIQNKVNAVKGTSISTHSGYTNTITLTGTADEISQELLPGEAANFVLTKAFNKADWTPPWMSQGLKEVLSESRCGKCESYKKLVQMKDSIDLKDVLSEENAGRISETQSIVGFGFLEFLMSREKSYTEKNVGYQRLILQFLFQGYENKNHGDRTYHIWENAMRNEEYSYGFKDVEEAEKEFKNWIEVEISGSNPCTCLTRGEIEKGIVKSPC